VAVPSSGRGAPGFDFVIGDFNGDGKLDLAYHLYGFTQASGLLLGRGDGSFSTSVEVVPPGTAKPITSQDLNGDKLADLIAIGTANNVEVWLNTSPTSGADLDLPSPTVSAGPYVVGTNLTFTANVVNQGPQDATGVIFTDTLPSGLTFVSATATPGSCVQTNGVVSCTIGALASAFESNISIVVAPTATGTLTNTMNVTGTQTDPNAANNSATQTLSIVPVFTLTVTDVGKGSGTVTASLGAINCGSTCSGSYAQGTSVSLTATAAAGSIFSSWSGACTGTDPNTCTIVVNSAQSVSATFNLPPDFSLSAAQSSYTLKTGQQVTDTLTLTQVNAFSGQVSLSCAVSGPAPAATCSVTPTTVTVGSSTASATLTMDAPTSLAAARLPDNGRRVVARVFTVFVPAFFLWEIGLAFWRPRKPHAVNWCTVACMLALLVTLVGCGGGSSPPPQNYTVTVNAASASGALQHSATVAVTVQ
jgi:uncharacterized repeat protein (TIGR01451 family)